MWKTMSFEYIKNTDMVLNVKQWVLMRKYIYGF